MKKNVAVATEPYQAGDGVPKPLIPNILRNELHQLEPALFAGILHELFERRHPTVGRARGFEQRRFQLRSIRTIFHPDGESRRRRGLVRLARGEQPPYERQRAAAVEPLATQENQLRVALKHRPRIPRKFCESKGIDFCT